MQLSDSTTTSPIQRFPTRKRKLSDMTSPACNPPAKRVYRSFQARGAGYTDGNFPENVMSSDTGVALVRSPQDVGTTTPISCPGNRDRPRQVSLMDYVSRRPARISGRPNDSRADSKEDKSGSSNVTPLGLQAPSKKCCELSELASEDGIVLCYNCMRVFSEDVASSVDKGKYSADGSTKSGIDNVDLAVRVPSFPANHGTGAQARVIFCPPASYHGAHHYNSNKSSNNNSNNNMDDNSDNPHVLRALPVLPTSIFRGLFAMRAAMARVQNQVEQDRPTQPSGPGTAEYEDGLKSSMGDMNIGTETCYKCRSNDHITRNCMVQVHRFFKFMELAPELRERIYEYALSTDHPISPHLCDSSVKFHDDSQRAHNAIDQLLGITKVSKQIRAESLPMFYSANAFNVGKDTTSYFDRLEHLGRFHMVRHVRFEIYMEKQDNAAVRLLRRMNQYIKEEDRYIKTLLWPVGASNAMLTRHPQYTNGGLPDLNTLITLRKLTSVFPNSATYSSKLVIPVPNAERVTSHDRLKWFPVVMYGLGISLHYVENVPFDYNENGRVGMTWHQKYQKKDFTESGGVAKYVDGQTEVYKRALELCPQLESQPRAKGSCYPRSNCRGMYKGWCDIPTEGGWVEELKID